MSQREDVSLVLLAHKSRKFGEDVGMVLNIKNESKAKRNVDVNIFVNSVYNHGPVAEKIRKEHVIFQLEPEEDDSFRLFIPFSAYYEKTPDMMLQIRIVGNVSETHQYIIKEHLVYFMMVTLLVQMPSAANVGETVKATLHYQNSLDIPLTKCKFIIEGSSTKRKEIMFRDIKPKEFINYDIELTPESAGPNMLIAHFSAAEIPNNSIGSSIMNVNEAKNRRNRVSTYFPDVPTVAE